MVVLIPIFTTLFKMAMAMLWNIFSIHVLTILFYFINTVVIWYYHDPNSNFPPKNFISEFVMRNERKVFGDGYCVVWAIYSSLYVVEKVGHYSFNFDNIIYATGGNQAGLVSEINFHWFHWIPVSKPKEKCPNLNWWLKMSTYEMNKFIGF